MRGDLENHFKGQIIPFGAMVEYHPISAKDQSRLATNSPRIPIGCGRLWGQTLRSWENWTRQKSTLEGPMLKKILTFREGEILRATKEDAEVLNDFLSNERDFVCRHKVEPRIRLYVPKEESFQIP